MTITFVLPPRAPARCCPRPVAVGLKVKLVYWFMRKGMAKMTGRAPAAGRSGIEPIEVWAHQPKLGVRVLPRPPQICRNSGFSDEELLALPRYRESDLFTTREKLALDYTVAVMRTPVEVTDELFARMKEHFSDEQLVEITALLTVVNLDRFNAAFGIGSAGFGEGMVCVLPDGSAGGPALARLA